MTANAHEKVIWLDISVDEVLCVYIFNPADHLKRGEKSINKYSRKLLHILFIKGQIRPFTNGTCLHRRKCRLIKSNNVNSLMYLV